MKKLLMIILFLLSVSSINAVKFRSVGSDAEFSVYVFEEEYYLILSFNDGGTCHLIPNTIVKFKLKDGTIIRLSGFVGSSSFSSNSVNYGYGFSATGTNVKNYTMLKITKEQIEQLKNGVDIVVINTIPDRYVRHKWSGKSKFGKDLYDDFINLKDEFSLPEISYDLY